MTMRIAYLFLLPLLAALAITTLPVLASTGMSNCREEPDDPDCNDQPDRVGNDEENDEDADRDGPDEKEDSNCWGKVTSEFASENQGIGDHSSDPVGGDDDNETPREGVGNQVEGHPSDHADTVGPRFGSDEECTED